MAKKGGKKAAKQPSLTERVAQVEKRQREFEAQMAEHEAHFNKHIDRQDKEWRDYRRTIRDIVGMFRQMAEKQIEFYERQEKAELRLDKHDERMTDFEKSMRDLANEQAEATRKLNALLDYEKRYRGNGQNGKRNNKEK